MCSDNVGLMLVQAERVIWKQQTRRGKERDRLKLGGECGLALKSCKNASSDRMKERMREIEERNVIGRDKSWVSSPQAVCFFFFSQSNRRWWEEIHRQVTQAPQSSRDYWDRGNIWKNDRSLSSKQCKLTHLPGCISRQEIYWSGK